MLDLTDYAERYDPELDFDRWYTVLAARRILPHLRPGQRVLELGSATGAMTAALAGEGRRFTCVERSAAYAARAPRLPGVDTVLSGIEAFVPAGRYDHILAVNVLHELEAPKAALRRLLPHLAPEGRLHVTLPNPASLHRLSAAGAGLIAHPAAPSARGLSFGTRRMGGIGETVGSLSALGLRLLARSAILPKPLPNADMDAVSDELIEAWDALSPSLPDHGAMTWFLFGRDDG